jgi:uncharacterized cupin superfamily protein
MSDLPRRHPNVVNLDELTAWSPPSSGPAPFGASVKRLASAAGSKQLGANCFSVPAGRTAVPLHAHHNNEEAIFVLGGKGTLQVGKDRIAVRAGDWIGLPAGEEFAHQLMADQGEPLEYLAISTMNGVDVVTYPNSGKLMAAVGGHPPQGSRHLFRSRDGNVDYWEGEGEAPKPGA